MKKRHVLLGIALAAASMLTFASCGGNNDASGSNAGGSNAGGSTATQSSQATGDLSNYQVTKDEFRTALTQIIDDYKYSSKSYADSISEANLTTTTNLAKKGNWAVISTVVYGTSMDYYYYIDGQTATSYSIDEGQVKATSTSMDSMSGSIAQYEEMYLTAFDQATFDENDKLYSVQDISESYSGIDITFGFKMKFYDKKLTYSETKIVFSSSSYTSTTYTITEYEYGNVTVNVPQTILDYHNQNYGKK